jgi:ribosomal protein L10
MKLSKKQFQLKLLSKILAENNFFAFLSVNSFTVKNKIELKHQLNKFGFDFKVLKNGLLVKAIQIEFPQYINMVPLSQGFSIIIYSVDNSKGIDFLKLKDLALLLKNQSNLLFLGGLYDNKIINKAFLKSTLLVKSSVEIYSDLISTINQSQFSLINSLQKVPGNLVHCIQSVDSSKNS